MKICFNRAMGLIDVLIGIAITLIALLAIVQTYQFELQVSNQSRLRSSAVALANKKIEQIKNLSYSEVGTINGYPQGNILEEEVDNSGSAAFTVKTKIIYAINCKDGVGSQAGVACPSNAYGQCPSGGCQVDECPNDYKMVYVDVFWGGKYSGSIKDQTIISPKTKEQECQEKGGFLTVEVSDSVSGDDIVSPFIEVERISTGQKWDATPESGLFTFVLPASITDYIIKTSKDGYSTERTYGIGERYLPTGQIIASPNISNPTINEGDIVEKSFKIDKLSPLIIYTKQIKSGSVYYVRARGNDSNNGLSPDSPFLTINKALKIADAGDIIYVGSGNYNENIDFSNSGSAGSPIIIVGDNQGTYTGDSGNVAIQATGTIAVNIDNKSYIEIYGFKITSSTDSGIKISNASNIKIIGNTIESNLGKGIYIDTSSDVNIKDNNINSNTYGALLEKTDNLVLYNNSIFQNTNYGLFVKDSSAPDISFSNFNSNGGDGFTIENSTGVLFNNNSIYSNSGSGVAFFNTDAQISSNQLYSNNDHGIYLQGSSSCLIKNNLLSGNNKTGLKLETSSKNNQIILNTFYDNKQGGVSIESLSSGSSLSDNIIAFNTGSGLYVNNSTSTQTDYDNIYGNTQDYTGITAGANSISLDPLFVNKNSLDFHLSQIASGQSQNSSCLDVGSANVVSFSLSNYSDRSDKQNDSDIVDLGYHYYIGQLPTATTFPDPFGSTISNVSFSISGSQKTIGKDDQEKLIYKISTSTQTDINGYAYLPYLEKEKYTFSGFTRLGLPIDLYASYPSLMPIDVSAGSTTTIKLGFKAQNSLAITVKDNATTNVIFGANVRIHNVSIDQSLMTNSDGKVLFIPLTDAIYNVEVSASGYATTTQETSVSGDVNQTINLLKI